MIGRRIFTSGLTAVALPLTARAQQPPLPVIGFLNGQSPEPFAPLVAAFHEGLSELGYVEGRNVAVVYRWGLGHSDRMPALASELIQLQVAVIFAAGGTAAVFAARTATASIPIVFVLGVDPVQLGLVSSIGRPGGNLTGVVMFTSALEQKRLALLHELLPSTVSITVLLNPTSSIFPELSRNLEEAARILGLQLRILAASTEPEIDAAFETMTAERAQALLIGSDPFLFSRRNQLVALAARHRIPTVYTQREYVTEGGLMSYASSVADAYRQAGLYIGRVLVGEDPAELPVFQPTTFEFVVNLRTAAALGITVPPSILVQATEVIE